MRALDVAVQSDACESWPGEEETDGWEEAG